MGKRWVKVWRAPGGAWFPATALLTLLFLTGGAAGCAMASWVCGSGSEGLASYIRSYLLAVQEGMGSSPSMPELCWEVFRYPLIVLALGFTALGAVGIPLVFAVRGFFLSFAVASFVRVFGGFGFALSAIVFGLPGAISIPVLFVLGAQGWTASREMAERLSRRGRRSSPYDRDYWVRCGVCAAGSLLCVWVERFLTADLLAALAGRL